jgi:proteasome accessory factor C
MTDQRVGRKGADEKLQRILALVPWVAAREGPALEEVCERFGCTEAELISDLDRLFMCGLYPYTPDVLIEVDVADGRVWIRYADYFSRPLRLTPAEGLALLAAGKAVQSFPGADQSGPLARGLAKLGRTVGVAGDDALDVALASVPEDVMAAIRTGVDEGRQLELDYYSFGRDEVTRRVVDPYAVFSAGGQWYLSAYCHAVDDDRLFRVDRVRAASPLDSPVEHSEGSVAGAVYHARDDDPRVTIELAPAAGWVAEQYPVETVKELRGGSLRVTLAVSERAWLERLLLRVGPDGKMTKATDPALADAGREAACRLLERYRSAAR